MAPQSDPHEDFLVCVDERNDWIDEEEDDDDAPDVLMLLVKVPVLGRVVVVVVEKLKDVA